MKESFTKIVVKAWGEDQLKALEKQAISRGISSSIFTEDTGEMTCLALGPADSRDLDPITGKLFLL